MAEAGKRILLAVNPLDKALSKAKLEGRVLTPLERQTEIDKAMKNTFIRLETKFREIFVKFRLWSNKSLPERRWFETPSTQAPNPAIEQEASSVQTDGKALSPATLSTDDFESLIDEQKLSSTVWA